MPRGDNPVTAQSKNGRLNILKRATKSVERPRRKRSAAHGRLLTSRTKGAKRAAAGAEKNPAMQVRAKEGAKAEKRRKNRHRCSQAHLPCSAEQLPCSMNGERVTRAKKAATNYVGSSPV